MGLRTYLIKRTIFCLIMIWAIMTVNFIIFALMPGDPIAAYVRGQERILSWEHIELLRKIYGLDVPLYERYFLYLKNMLTFNFGNTRYGARSIAEEMMSRLGNTLLLMSIAEFAALILGTLFGTYIASKRGTKTDTGVVTASLILGSLPVFWIGWLILFFFAIRLGWFPIHGSIPRSWVEGSWPTNPIEIILGRLWCVALPAITLTIFTVDNWTLFTRACVLEAITEDYVITARAKGLKERTVLLKHVLKNASLPLVTSIVLMISGLWGGAMITETVFGYEGMGRWIYWAIETQDIPTLYVIFYISAITTVFANFIADLLYGVLDPRIKVGQ